MKSLNWTGIGVAAFVVATMCGEALAVPTIDGNASVADGYASLSTQNTNTHFGDANTGDAINGGGGSEIDQIFGKIEGGRLYIVVAGNLETNFNKLDVFIDSEAGGQSTLDGSTLPLDVDGFCCGGTGSTNGALQAMGGGPAGTGIEKITFDTGFAADYYLTFTHGFEMLRPNIPAEKLTFYAATAHYAELNNGPSGRNVAAGMQLAQRGLPNVLRGTTADFDTDGTVDGGEFLTWQRNFGGLGLTRSEGDATGEGDVNADDLSEWESAFGFNVANSSLADFPFAPQTAGTDNSEALLGPALNGGLSQGDLIDKNYALAAGGCADETGAGCLPKELEFALDVDTLNDPANTFSHRNFDNVIGLQMAFDNSNTAGVDNGDEHAGDYTTTTTFDTSAVTTGIEFSIPLSEIGNPSATDIRITAFINNGDHNFLSNQVSGVGILDENLGPPGFADFSNATTFPGDQFVTLAVPLQGLTAVPEPSSLALVWFGTVALGWRRKR